MRRRVLEGELGREVALNMMVMTIIMTLTTIVTFGEDRLTEFIYVHQHKRQL